MSMTHECALKTMTRSPRVDFTWSHMSQCGQASMMSTLHPQENAESCNNKQRLLFYHTESPDPATILSQQGSLDSPLQSPGTLLGETGSCVFHRLKTVVLLAVKLLSPMLTHHRLHLPWRKSLGLTCWSSWEDSKVFTETDSKIKWMSGSLLHWLRFPKRSFHFYMLLLCLKLRMLWLRCFELTWAPSPFLRPSYYGV